MLGRDVPRGKGKGKGEDWACETQGAGLLEAGNKCNAVGVNKFCK